MTNNTTVAYNCPNCGAELKFDADKQMLCCEFCNSEFAPEEMTNGFSQTASEEYCSHMNEYCCPNCGAEIVADENTAADTCLYCHSPVMLKGRLSGQMRPDRVIPFKYGKEEAIKRFMDFAKKKRFAPRDFKSQAQAELISGIYYPFWVTDADSNNELQADATRLRVWRTGRYEYTETSKFKLIRNGNIHFEDIVTSAYSEADKNMLEGVLPYPSDALVAFDASYLSGFVAKKRDIEMSQITEEVRQRMQGYSEQLLRSTIRGGYATVHISSNRMDIKNSSWEYSLMPIWLLTYTPKKRGKKIRKYTFAMNGYTGKLYGQIPISYGKVAALCGTVFTVVASVVAAIGGLLL